jgi:hypothetical protein
MQKKKGITYIKVLSLLFELCLICVHAEEKKNLNEIIFNNFFLLHVLRLDWIRKDFLLERFQLHVVHPGWQNRSRISMLKVYAENKTNRLYLPIFNQTHFSCHKD